MKKIYSIFKISVLGWLREGTALFFTFMFPAVFFIIFSLAFRKGPYSPERTFYIYVVNKDNSKFAEKFYEILKTLKYDSGKDIFHVELKDKIEDKLIKDVKTGKYSGILEINKEFSEYVMDKGIEDAVKKISLNFYKLFKKGNVDFSYFDKFKSKMKKGKKGEPTDTLKTSKEEEKVIPLNLYGMEKSLDFVILKNIINGVLKGFIDKVSDSTLSVISKYMDLKIEKNKKEIMINEISLAPEKITTFDYIVPGLFIFSILMMLSGLTISLTYAFELGHIKLLRLTKLKPIHYITGEILGFLILTIIQFFIMFSVAFFFGYHVRGNVFVMLPVIILAGISTGAIGMIIASFSKTTKQANSIAVLVGIILGFAGGIFYYVKTPEIFKGFEILDIVPMRHASIIFKNYLTLGEPILQSFKSIMVLTIETLILFVISLFIYSKKRTGYLG